MRYLLSTKNLKKINRLSISNTLYAFDFDGTLSKINKNIAKATIPSSTHRLLSILSYKAPVAIISGRGLLDLKKRIKIPDAYLIGNHGLEGLSKLRIKQSKAKAICAQWLKFLESHGFDKGIFIEDKKYSLSIHFRDSKNRKASAFKLEKIFSELIPAPRIVNGKCVYNVIPRESPNKGTALIEIKNIEKVKNVFYIGDDDTDEDVFKLSQPSVITVRVGKKQSSKAKYYLKRQSEINKLLKIIIKSFEV